MQRPDPYNLKFSLDVLLLFQIKQTSGTLDFITPAAPVVLCETFDGIFLFITARLEIAKSSGKKEKVKCKKRTCCHC